jgi:hypothetical protein
MGTSPPALDSLPPNRLTCFSLLSLAPGFLVDLLLCSSGVFTSFSRAVAPNIPRFIYLAFCLEHRASVKPTFPPLETMSSVTVPEKIPDESSKLKTFLSILRKYAFLAWLD